MIALVAIVVEACFGASLGLRMAQGAGFPFDIDGAICSSGAKQQTADRQQPAQPSSGDHEHNPCLLCHAGAAPAIVATAGHVPNPPAARKYAPQFTAVATRATTRPAPYVSRAPPLNA